MTRRGEGPDIAAFDLLDPEDPFEIDAQNAHLAKHAYRTLDDALDVWAGDPEFYEDDSGGPADWIMVGEVPGGDVLVVPLAPSNHSGYAKMRPIGVYEASQPTVDRYRADREG